MVLIGALATPGYSHIGEHVSTLYQSGAPNGTWIAALFAVYNLLILAFGVGVFRLVSNRGGARRRIGQAGGVALVLTAIAGVMDVVFRQDPIGSPATTAGTLHVAFAGVASLLTILAIALVASWALARPELRGFGWYSVATLVVIAVSGPVAAVPRRACGRRWACSSGSPSSASSSGPPSPRSSSPGGSLSHARRPGRPPCARSRPGAEQGEIPPSPH